MKITQKQIAITAIIVAVILALIDGIWFSKPADVFDNKNAQIGNNFQGEFTNSPINLGEEKIPAEEDFFANIYKENQFIIELRPKQRSWYPFYVALLQKEKNEVNCQTHSAPAGTVPNLSWSWDHKSSSSNNDWFVNIGSTLADQDHSYYLYCDKPPSVILFGETDNLELNYCIEIKNGEWQKCIWQVNPA